MAVAVPTATLYLQCLFDKNVFIYTAVGDGTWRFSRHSSCQSGKNVFVLLYRPSADGQEAGWELQDHSVTAVGPKSKTIGTPNPPATQDPSRPPLGPWRVWGVTFMLTDCVPEHPPPTAPFQREFPFARINYLEEGSAARLNITMLQTAIEDDVFEDVLAQMKHLLRNLASRPHMILFIRSDAQDCPVPNLRHVRRYLAFIQENGTEFVLAGRGHAVIVRPRTLLGSTLIGIIKMVQRLLPPPWEEVIVPTTEEAETFLRSLAKRYASQGDDKMVQLATEAAASSPSSRPEHTVAWIDSSPQAASPPAAASWELSPSDGSGAATAAPSAFASSFDASASAAAAEGAELPQPQQPLPPEQTQCSEAPPMSQLDVPSDIGSGDGGGNALLGGRRFSLGGVETFCASTAETMIDDSRVVDAGGGAWRRTGVGGAAWSFLCGAGLECCRAETEAPAVHSPR